jgi:hypothetical protein
VTQLAAAVAHLGIPDQLAIAEPQSAEQLAKAVGADTGAVARTMRALASVGVFEEREPGQYALTPIGTRLRSDVPDSMRDLFLAETDEVHRRAWDRLVDAIRSGEPQPKAVFGGGPFEYYSEHQKEGEQFGRAMQNVSALAVHGVMAKYDFSTARLIVDVGGGNGSFVRAILQQQPQARGIVFDLPYIEPQATTSIRQDGLSSRCQFDAGDFFKAVPPGGDIYLLKMILHDWTDEESRRILASIRKAIAPNGRVLVVELLVPENNEPGFVQLMDINMLVMTGGLERTPSEFGALLADAGLRLTRTIPTGTPFGIVEGAPA